jgi:hypothetical protein
MNTIGDIKDQSDLKIELYYSNIGKSPAINLNSSFYGGTATFPEGWDPFLPATLPNDPFLPIAVGPNHTCDGLLPSCDGLVVFPDASTKQWIESVIYRKTILPSILVNKGVLFLEGCFVYETMNEIHKTWFCLIAYADGQLSTVSKTVQCKDSQGAN